MPNYAILRMEKRKLGAVGRNGLSLHEGLSFPLAFYGYPVRNH